MKLSEECAVFGISSTADDTVGIVCNSLVAMQHRGQEGAGIAVTSGHRILCVKNTGLVSEVLTPAVVSRLPACHAAIGHCRYSTTGSNTRENVQPFVTEYLTGRLATAHNGNIVNAGTLRNVLRGAGVEFGATSDTEVISSLIAYETIKAGSPVLGAARAARQLRGAFCLVVLTSDERLIAIRDPYGFRPLCIGESETGTVVASESCALASQGYRFVRDVRPGEMIVLQNGRLVSSEMIFTDHVDTGLCIFEFVYFSRTDSVIDGLSVYEARVNMGRMLAREHPVDADIVCGIPDSGMEAALGYSLESGLPMVPGFVKNKYIGRSFIFPTQRQRETAVKMKLNPLAATLSGKRVILVDDSLVRGTTSAKIIQSVRDAGAVEVHMRISSPPFTHTCHFGTDVDSRDTLIANLMDLEGIRRHIGADSLGYISIAGLKSACEGCHLQFCTGCFTGHYPVNPGVANKQELD
ncbi:MAG: amidophosphoribosyltransferase [Clostridiaceae bacterium]|nr:amidophosphoribosyltransferase [Clostridiaceae bacterium]